MEKEQSRCGWCNQNNPVYVAYHDKEWGVPTYDDGELFELLVLESFQAGLSWECVLNKREAFREAFDGFELNAVCCYGEEKIRQLMENANIIRNRRKIDAAITNAKIYQRIQKEYGSFSKYIWHFTKGRVIYETGKVSSKLSDDVSEDLKKRGMKFVGTKIIYSYLQSAGIIYSHEESCFKYREKEE